MEGSNRRPLPGQGQRAFWNLVEKNHQAGGSCLAPDTILFSNQDLSDKRMATHETTSFLAGVIEGFYGQPWTPAERFELFDRMASWGLNTYVYAPKDDFNHRAVWREHYPG